MASLICTFTATQSTLGPDSIAISELNKSFTVETPVKSGGATIGAGVTKTILTAPTKDCYMFLKMTGDSGDTGCVVDVAGNAAATLRSGDFCFFRVPGALAVTVENKAGSTSTIEWSTWECETQVAR
jgi:hypothetical protein